MQIRTFVDKVLIRIEIFQHNILFVISCIDLLNHLGKSFFSFCYADQFSPKHRKSAALKGDHSHFDIRIAACLSIFQLLDQPCDLPHNFADAIRGVHYKHNIAGQRLLRAGQGQRYSRVIFVIQICGGLGAGDIQFKVFLVRDVLRIAAVIADPLARPV